MDHRPDMTLYVASTENNNKGNHMGLSQVILLPSNGKLSNRKEAAFLLLLLLFYILAASEVISGEVQTIIYSTLTRRCVILS